MAGGDAHFWELWIVASGVKGQPGPNRQKKWAEDGREGRGCSQPPHVAEVIAPIIARARLIPPDAATFIALAVDIVEAEGGKHERARCPNR